MTSRSVWWPPTQTITPSCETTGEKPSKKVPLLKQGGKSAVIDPLSQQITYYCTRTPHFFERGGVRMASEGIGECQKILLLGRGPFPPHTNKQKKNEPKQELPTPRFFVFFSCSIPFALVISNGPIHGPSCLSCISLSLSPFPSLPSLFSSLFFLS